jgi:TetR/AcrR family transcriptional regulator
MLSKRPLTERPTRIQRQREKLILDAALELFATYGYRGTTIDQIADKASLSKPNLLYYFRNKEHIYTAVLQRTMEGWLDPLRAIDPAGDPIVELSRYVDVKIDMSFANPQASRLFAFEVQGGAEHLHKAMLETLKPLVDEKTAVIQRWIDDGKLRPVDPHHLIFSIWSVTQHYADFAVQIDLLLGAPPIPKTTKRAIKDILLRGLTA